MIPPREERRGGCDGLAHRAAAGAGVPGGGPARVRETGLIVGLVLPGEVTLLLVGFMCSLGTLNPWLASGIMTVAALAGDSVGFAEGKRYGRRLEASRLGQWVGEKRWAKTDALLDRHGGRAVVFARYV